MYIPTIVAGLVFSVSCDTTGIVGGEEYNITEELVIQSTFENELVEGAPDIEQLLQIFPASVASRLSQGLCVTPEYFDSVTILFSDIVGFTKLSSGVPPLKVFNMLNKIFIMFDRIVKRYDLYKLETVGDCYMVASGLPERNGDRHVGEIASAALDLLEAVKNYSCPSWWPEEALKMRFGIHTGAVVAGVLGLTRPKYTLFGDTVNTASRMESSGQFQRIHISGETRRALESLGGYTVEDGGLVEVKGKGKMLTHWLTGSTDTAVRPREVLSEGLPDSLACQLESGLETAGGSIRGPMYHERWKDYILRKMSN